MLNHSGSVPQVPTVSKISFLILAVCFSIFIIFTGFAQASPDIIELATNQSDFNARWSGSSTAGFNVSDGKIYGTDDTYEDVYININATSVFAMDADVYFTSNSAATDNVFIGVQTVNNSELSGSYAHLLIFSGSLLKWNRFSSGLYYSFDYASNGDLNPTNTGRFHLQLVSDGNYLSYSMTDLSNDNVWVTREPAVEAKEIIIRWTPSVSWIDNVTFCPYINTSIVGYDWAWNDSNYRSHSSKIGTDDIYVRMPAGYGTDSKLSMFFHSNTQEESQLITDANFKATTAKLSKNNYSIIASDYGGSLWGNEVSQTAVTAAYNYMLDNFSTENGEIYVWGRSLGGITFLNWAMDSTNASLVKRAAFVSPVTNLTETHSSASFQSAINTAYGTDNTNFEADTVGYHPENTPSNYTNYWMLMWYGTADTTIPPAKNCIDFSTQVNNSGGNITLVEKSGLGHIFEMNATAVLEFFNLYSTDAPTLQPPQNVTTIPHQTWINISWDAVPNADKYSVYELENGFPYVDIDPVVNGIKDAIYDYAHEFLIFSPNPVSLGDYGTIYPVRTSLGAYLLIECVDNDDKLGDDDTIYYFDIDNDGLTVNDPAWKITNNGIKKYLWDGGSWQVTGVSNAVGASTGGGTHYPIHELFIPIAELGANWTNGSTVKVLVKREDSSLSPDVVTWYPYGNINDTDTSLWQEMVLNDPESYILLDNTTNLWYNATGLIPFTIYHGAVSAWNGSVESNYTLFDAITEDLLTYSVSGTVSDPDGNPITNAIVYSCNGFVHEITTTNVSGYWVGSNFREDNYTICATKTGYYENSIDIFVDSNLTNQNITLTVVPLSKYHEIGVMFFAIPTILSLVFQKIADVIPIIVVLVFIMLIINVIGVAIHAIRGWH